MAYKKVSIISVKKMAVGMSRTWTHESGIFDRSGAGVRTEGLSRAIRAQLFTHAMALTALILLPCSKDDAQWC